MKKFIVLLFLVILGESLYIFLTFKMPAKIAPVAKPLLAYSFTNLKKTTFPSNPIVLGNKVSEDGTSFSQVFYFSTVTSPKSKELKNVSGLMNAPTASGKYPVIIMVRGFVPLDMYQSGVGTEPVAKQLAENGFITLAPDFLGYAQSSAGAADSFENRFQTYTTLLSLFSSLSTINSALSSSYSATLSADLSKVGLWGHSNGGHIALASLAISGLTYPTVLWAPVSASFPYSILYYTDESDDQGKALRKALAQFETVYNTDVFSPPNYYQWIKAPLEVEQGTADMEVPYWWSDNLVATLKKDKVNATEHVYTGGDHNLLPSSVWDKAVSDTLQFYKTEFAE